MQQLTGINIRRGMELEVPIEEIFSINMSSEGDVRVKHYYLNLIEKTEEFDDSIHQNFLTEVKKQEVVEYKEVCNTIQLNENLKVVVYDHYSITYSRFLKNKYDCNLTQELIFVNSEKLSFADFCFNFMTAQSYTGKIPNTIVQHQFIGIGELTIEQSASIYPLAIAGNLSLECFFIDFDGILASIQKIINGEIEKDIYDQKEYLSEKEFQDHLSDLNKHQQSISQILENNTHN